MLPMEHTLVLFEDVINGIGGERMHNIGGSRYSILKHNSDIVLHVLPIFA